MIHIADYPISLRMIISASERLLTLIELQLHILCTSRLILTLTCTAFTVYYYVFGRRSHNMPEYLLHVLDTVLCIAHH